MPTHCCLLSINSAWLCLKFGTTCFPGDCDMSQVEKVDVNSPGEVLRLWQWVSCRACCCHLISQSHSTVIITTSHSTPQSQQGRRKPSLYNCTASSLIPVTLRSIVTGRSFLVAHLHIFSSQSTDPSLLQIFILLKLEDPHE
jgi:hypothetical protein